MLITPHTNPGPLALSNAQNLDQVEALSGSAATTAPAAPTTSTTLSTDAATDVSAEESNTDSPAKESANDHDDDERAEPSGQQKRPAKTSSIRPAGVGATGEKEHKSRWFNERANNKKPIKIVNAMKDAGQAKLMQASYKRPSLVHSDADSGKTVMIVGRRTS